MGIIRVLRRARLNETHWTLQYTAATLDTKVFDHITSGLGATW